MSVAQVGVLLLEQVEKLRLSAPRGESYKSSYSGIVVLFFSWMYSEKSRIKFATA